MVALWQAGLKGEAKVRHWGRLDWCWLFYLMRETSDLRLFTIA